MAEQETAYSTGKLYRILAVVIVLICFGIGVWAYPQLPDRVPSHWNAAGEVNGYTSQAGGAFLLPGILAAVLILLYLIPRIDPKRSNFRLMGKVYWLVVFVVSLFLGLIYTGTILNALGLVHSRFVPLSAHGGVGILFIVLGNYLPKIKYNYMFGIRTPWTLASEEVWYKTHRALGPLWVVLGIAFLFAGFLPAAWTAPFTMSLVLILALGSMGYSYVVFRKLKE